MNEIADREFAEMFYELEDVVSVEETGYKNMCDISVEGNSTFLLGNGILSHNSAQGSISKIVGRQGCGFYAMFGVPPNAYDMPLTGKRSITASPKLKDLKDILGLQYSKTIQDDINFKNIIITTDFDLPGHFIAGQLLGLFYRFGKNLFDEGRIKRFVTPLMVAKDNNNSIKKWFYSFDDYRAYEAKATTKFKYEYKKGLGSWNQDELEYIIDKDGLENMLEVMVLDDDAAESIDSWLNGARADKRKEMLEGYEFNIMNL